MIVALSLLIGQVFKDQPLGNDYRPGFYPQILSKGKRKGAFALGGSVRGYRPVMAIWEFPKSIQDINAALLKDKRVGPDRTVPVRGGRHYEFNIGDRKVTMTVEEGRRVIDKAGRTTGRLMDHKNAFTTVQVIETPLPVGRMPKAWPKVAKSAAKVVSSFPGIGLSGVPKQPDEWTSDLTPVGATQYWMKWYVKGDPKVVVPRLYKELEAAGKWRMGKLEDPVNVRCEPSSKQSLFVWLSFSKFPVKTGKDEWTAISASWSDLSTMPSMMRRARGVKTQPGASNTN